MSQLTDEQRQRIEENRLKALKRRAELSNSNNSANSTASKGNNFYNQPTKSSAPQTNGIPFASNAKSNITTNSFKPSAVSENVNTFLKPYKSNNTKETSNKFLKNPSSNFTSRTVTSAANGKQSFSALNSKVLRGKCVMLSRSRFFVDVSYHKELIEVFKTIPSKLYDTQSKKWNFLVKDHEKLLSAAKPLQPDVLIIPLPPLVVKTFLSAPVNKIIEDHDLSSLDPVMLKALLPFQIDGVNFAIQHNGRILIADDMGLGKTIQAIAIANYYSKDWPLLVVTPSSVRYSWEEAFHRWLPSLDPQEISVINSGKDHIPNNKVILMSYDLLTKMKSSVLNRKFGSIIVDESHFLKSYKSNRTKAALEVMKTMKRVILLTGTPALSRPMELYTQISSLKPKDFMSYKEYGIRYCEGKQSQWGWDFSGSCHMEELQLLLEETVMIRRLKSDVIKQLPAKFRQMIVLDPSQVSTNNKVLQHFHQKMQMESLKGMERRGALLEYFHQTGEVKLKAVCGYVLDLLESDKKFICFAHHQAVLKGIANTIEQKKIDFIYIDGSVTSEQRKHLCDRFQVKDTCRVAVLSITSANCGITLTAASLVVFAELFWNPGILTQAEDRAHRIGQEDSVVVQYLVAKGTADDEIWPLVQRKLDILNKAGLSKDNFRSADTIVHDDRTQPTLNDFWGELDESLELLNSIEDYDVPEKRLKLDSE